jgi:hypothetical protein
VVTPEEEARTQLVSKSLEFHLQAMAAPNKYVQGARLVLALLCIVGAFGAAGWLITQGPPKPKAATVEYAEPSQASQGASGASGAEGTTGTTGEDATGSSDSTTSLNEEAPWVFAIVALLVGAFLAAGQSFDFGGSPQKPAEEGGNGAAPAPAGPTAVAAPAAQPPAPAAPLPPPLPPQPQPPAPPPG